MDWLADPVCLLLCQDMVLDPSKRLWLTVVVESCSGVADAGKG